MIESFSPTIAFIKVDFPTFGFPIILTNPDLCAIVPVIIPKFFAKIVKRDEFLVMNYKVLQFNNLVVWKFEDDTDLYSLLQLKQ
jgi:hypothetical protein